MKVTVVGAGNVGATAAECTARMDIADEVVLIDIVDGLPQGKALDMAEAAPIHLFDTKVTGTNDYADTAGSDICVITAGLARKPGMSRDDLLAKNAAIVKSVTDQFVAHSPDSIIIVVSNPLDVMTYVSYMSAGFPSHRVMGMAGVLDTARYRAFLSMELGVSVKDIQALLMGGHGDTMVPLPSYTTIGGIALTQLLSKEKIDAIVDRTKFGGGEIVKLMGTSAWYAPGAAAAQMVEAIIKDSGRVLPCAVWLTGQWGQDGLFMGAPARLGRNGVEEIIEVALTDDERALLDQSAQHVRDNVAKLESLQAAG
ncbi:MAG: malate dehydrogenase [Rhodothermales bacterium]|nr:malate dehydrogenase [Rhodothermales bacterium]MBO6781323.1 malate dehydrogenase [Rhodothermales bacterium]